jgi:hypothetical protein
MDRFDLAKLDPAAVFEMGAPFRDLYGVIVTGRRDGKKPADDLFRFGIRTIGYTYLTIRTRKVPSAFILQFLSTHKPTFGYDLFSPACVLGDHGLDLFGRKLRKIYRPLVQQ